MSKINDLTGKKFGLLEVVSITDKRKNGKVIWLCKCECENFKKVISCNLQNGSTISCGCYNKSNKPKVRIKHGMHNSRIYNIYICMKERCYNPNSKSYIDYGKRGITICPEWLGEKGFENFYSWSMENGYDKDLSIDRIDNDGNYEPSNCRWATSIMQNNNTRRNHYITLEEEKHTISEWCRIKKISRSTVVARMKNGWSVEDAFNTPVKKRKICTLNN